MSKIEMLLAGHGDCLVAEVGTLVVRTQRCLNREFSCAKSSILTRGLSYP